MPKRLQASATVINCGAYRIERAPNKCWTHIYHVFTDFQLKCVELIDRIEVDDNCTHIYLKGDEDSILLKGIPHEAITLIEWMITSNQSAEKMQHLDSQPLENSSDISYTVIGKQNSQIHSPRD